MGAKCGIIEPDKKTFEWLMRYTNKKIRPVYADKDATYSQLKHFNVNKLSPKIAMPHRVDNVVDIDEVKGKLIDEAFIGTCTNGRLIDLKIAALILRGKKVHTGVRLVVAPA